MSKDSLSCVLYYAEVGKIKSTICVKAIEGPNIRLK